MVGLLLIGGCRNKKIFIFKGISATAAAGEASSKVKPQLSTLKNIKQKKADSKIAPMMQLQQVEKIQQTKELMPLNIQKGKQKALFVK